MPEPRRFPVKLVVILAIALLITLVVSVLDLSPNLSRLDAGMLSGPERGNYHAVVDSLAARARDEGGRLRNLTTGGTVDNLDRLAAAAADCSAEFAVVQDGIPAPEGAQLELIGRLRKSESVFFLGRGAAAITRFDQLRGLRIGVGPSASGTDHLARQILADSDLAPLGMILSNHGLAEQLDLLSRGELDLGVFVLDEDADLIRTAIRDRGLEIAAFEHLDVIARRHKFLSYGRIGAGQYDLIRVLPATDKRVFRVGTLIVGNRCASHAENIALLSALSQEFPEFMTHNREASRNPLFPTNRSAERFFEEGGPGFADLHAPWLVSIMPPSNWVYVAMAISLFMNLTTFWHRFRLWRIDVHTDKANQLIHAVVGETLTPVEMARLEPKPAHATKEALASIDRALAALDRIRARCRTHANSILVPMGQEWIYRYSEQQIEETLTAIRGFRARAAALAEREQAAPEKPDEADTETDAPQQPDTQDGPEA